MNKTECPLCGNNNQCALTQSDRNSDISDCWCKTTPIPKDVLNKIPTEDRGQRCICKRCAQQVDQLSQEVK